MLPVALLIELPSQAGLNEANNVEALQGYDRHYGTNTTLAQLAAFAAPLASDFPLKGQ